jgi:hypothetical protein
MLNERERGQSQKYCPLSSLRSQGLGSLERKVCRLTGSLFELSVNYYFIVRIKFVRKSNLLSVFQKKLSDCLIP